MSATPKRAHDSEDVIDGSDLFSNKRVKKHGTSINELLNEVLSELTMVKSKTLTISVLNSVIEKVGMIRAIVDDMPFKNDIMKELTDLKDAVMNMTKTPTYAEVTQHEPMDLEPTNAETASEMPFTTVRSRKGKSKKKTTEKAKQQPKTRTRTLGVVTITTGDKNINGETIMAKLKETVNPAEKGMKVQKIIQQNTGVKLVLDLEGCKALSADQALKDAGLTVTEAPKKSPKMIIYDVSTEYSKVDVENGLRKQNNLVEGCDLTVRTAIGKGTEVRNWVIEVSPEVRTALRKRGRVHIQYNSCRVKDFALPTQCYKCQKFGHTSKHCKSGKDTCSQCGVDGHNYKSCPKSKESRCCANCTRASRPSNHSVSSNRCPIYKKACEIEKLNTYA